VRMSLMAATGSRFAAEWPDPDSGSAAFGAVTCGA
jgi:hypothetical protein